MPRLSSMPRGCAQPSRASRPDLCHLVGLALLLTLATPFSASAQPSTEDPSTEDPSTPAPLDETLEESAPAPLDETPDQNAPAPVAETFDENAPTPLDPTRLEETLDDPGDETAPSPPDETESLLLEAGPPRSFTDRYVDALAGSWAGTGILVAAAGAFGAALGAGAGCLVQSEAGCIAGAWGGTVVLASLGWIAGPGVGTARGAGLDAGEGFAMWALGFLTNTALIGLGTLTGFAVDQTGGTWGLGLVWGMITGTALGALAQVFLTPLYAVALFEERAPSSDAQALRITPLLAPTEHGAVGGIMGAF